ncbi:MAG: BrnT family toxin [Dehalococcoidia bacterium]|nr:BrnT family toxin [Dehalococcoidia bacterium]
MIHIGEIRISPFVEEHIWTKHHVTPEEVEEVCFSDPLVRRGRSHSYAVYGRTEAGRHLIVFLYPAGGGVFRLATARDMEQAEQHRYQRSKGR